MTVVLLAILLLLHYLTGYGLLRLFKIKLTSAKQVALALLTGIIIHSFVPFLLQLLYIPITFTSVSIGLLAVTLALSLPFLKDLRSMMPGSLKANLFPRVQTYEWPFILALSIILFASLWRSYYLPVFARDMLSGPEVLAEYTVREHTMINSVFNVNLETTNNHHKPPYVLGLQIIYKLAGFQFGQIWVSFIALAFSVFLYQLLKERVHAIIAGMLVLLFTAIPEVYAYTYIMLFDYSNMVFFFLAAYFLQQYFNTTDKNKFYFSVLLFAFATFIRLETLAFIVMMVPALWLYSFRKKLTIKSVALYSVLMVALPIIVYFLWVNIYLRYYMPAQFHLGQQINPSLADLSPLFVRFKEMHTRLLFGKLSLPLWGYYIWVFLILVVADLLMYRKIIREARNWYYASAVIYFGLPLLGYLLPLMDLLHTTKRGLFKLFPFMLLILANTHLLQRLSLYITNWELSNDVANDKKTS